MARRTVGLHEKIRPYYMTDEVVQLTGVTRRFLTTLVNRGVLRPHVIEGISSVGWTQGQVDDVRTIKRLRTGGLSIDAAIEVLNAQSRDTDVKEQLMQQTRDVRRDSKRSVYNSIASTYAEQIGHQKSFYIRYLPQRWLAMAPCGGKGMIGDDYTSSLLNLVDIATRVGWVTTSVTGLALGMPDFSTSPQFAFVELAAQPDPSAKLGMSADCGCYRQFGGECRFEKPLDDCRMCTLFGSAGCGEVEQDAAEGDQTGEASWRPLLLETMQRPYLHGPWQGMSSRGLMAEQFRTEMQGEPPVAARPQFMPLEVELPAGVTACVMPAGMYLCRQCEVDEQPAACSEMFGVTRFIPHRDLTERAERAQCERLKGLVEDAKMFRCFSHPDDFSDIAFAAPQIGDPACFGWWKNIRDRELSNVFLLTSTGLTSLSDYPVLCASIPTGDSDALPRLELQALVDAEALFKAQGIRGEHGSSSASKAGIMPSLKKLSIKRSTPPQMRCRTCQALIEVDSGESVHLCEHCGKAQAVPHMSDLHRTYALLRADELRKSGNYEEAESIYRHAYEDDPTDAEACWMTALCKYGVHFEESLTTGAIVVVMDNPGPDPIVEDEHFRTAQEIADDAQWSDVYSTWAPRIQAAWERATSGDGRAGDLRVGEKSFPDTEPAS